MATFLIDHLFKRDGFWFVAGRMLEGSASLGMVVTSAYDFAPRKLHEPGIPVNRVETRLKLEGIEMFQTALDRADAGDVAMLKLAALEPDSSFATRKVLTIE